MYKQLTPFVALALVAGLAACGENGTGAGRAEMRVVNLSPGLDSMSLWMDGSEVSRDLGSMSGTDYMPVEAGATDLRVTETGSAAPLMDMEMRFDADTRRTLAVYGGTNSLRAVAFLESGVPVPAGFFRVRIINVTEVRGILAAYAQGRDGREYPVAVNMESGMAGATVDVPMDTPTMRVEFDDAPQEETTYELPELEEGSSTNLFVASPEPTAPSYSVLMGQKESGDLVEIQPSDFSGLSALRVLHLSPEAPNVDVFINGAEPAAVADIPFTTSTGFLKVEARTDYDIDISPASAGLASAVLQVRDLPLDAGQSYTAVAIGGLADLRALALQEDLSEVPAGQIRVRAIHAAAGVGEVDIYALDEAGGTQTAIYENVPFGAAGGYLELPAGAYVLGLDVDDDARVDVLFRTPALAEGTIANLFALSREPGAVSLFAQFPEGTAEIPGEAAPQPMGNVRVVHLSPDAPGINVYADGDESPLVSGLHFLNSTDYAPVFAGDIAIDISPASGTLNDSLLTVDGFIEEDGFYTVVAFDSVSNLHTIQLEDDFSPVAPGAIRVRAIHAAVGVGPVDVWAIPASGVAARLYDDVPFGIAGDFLEVPEGTYTIGLDVNEDHVLDVSFALPAIPAGTVANIFAVTDAHGAVSLVAQH